MLIDNFIGFNEHIDEQTYSNIEEFVCKLYGKNPVISVDELRLEVFLQKYKPENSDEAIILCQENGL